MAPATITLDRPSVEIPAEGGVAAVSYKSNQSAVSIGDIPLWLSAEKRESGFVFSAEANSDGAERSATVVFTAGAGGNTATAELFVSQQAMAPPEPTYTLTYIVEAATADKEMPLPALSSDDTDVIFTVDWGDGSAAETFTESLTPAVKHVYAQPGSYRVAIVSENLITAVSFSGNASVVSVEDNQMDWSGVTSLRQAFYQCRSLQSVPAGLLKSCASVTDASRMFYGCTALQAVPSGLFDALAETKTFANCFQGCSSLTTLPAGLFSKCSSAETFTGVFRGCTALKAVPDRLFDGCSAATVFEYCFYECSGLVSIGADVFRNCRAAWSFDCCFTDCALTDIPVSLFADCPEAIGFNYTFQNNSKLKSIPASLFDNCRKITGLDFCFSRCTGLTGESPYTEVGGKKVHLYERSLYPDAFPTPPVTAMACFMECRGLSDAAYMALNYPDWINY